MDVHSSDHQGWVSLFSSDILGHILLHIPLYSTYLVGCVSKDISSKVRKLTTQMVFQDSPEPAIINSLAEAPASLTQLKLLFRAAPSVGFFQQCISLASNLQNLTIRVEKTLQDLDVSPLTKLTSFSLLKAHTERAVPLIEKFALLTNLERLSFQWTIVPRECPAFLAPLTRLTYLSLEGTGLTQAVKDITTLTNLEILDLGFSHDHTKHFQGFTKLKALFCVCFPYEDNYKYFPTTLEELHLAKGGRDSHPRLYQIGRHLPNLKTFTMEEPLQDLSWQPFEGLTSLHIGKTPHPGDMQSFQWLTNLTSLNTGEVSFGSIKILSMLTNLKHLKLGVEAVDYSPLAYLTNLSRLSLPRSPIGIENVSFLEPLSNLSYLSLPRASFKSSTEFACLSNFTALTHLVAPSLKHASSIQFLAPLTSLTNLSLDAWADVTAEGFKVLECLTSLTKLSISRFSDLTGCLPSLMPLRHLQIIQITASGPLELTFLKGFESLKKLDLNSSELPQTCFDNFRHFHRRTLISLAGCGISRSAIKDFVAETGINVSV